MNNILIIDDDRKLRDLLQQYLTSQGFAIDMAESAEHARVLLEKKHYKLIIVDVMMSGESGIEFTKKFKQSNDTPVLMLTAMGEVEDRIKGLESGADDYLSKPFEPKELYLRAIKLIERNDNSNVSQKPKIIKFGEFEFNLENCYLTKNGKRVFLSSTETDMLQLFCNNINVPIDRYELAKKFNGISERSVDVQVTRLRKKIEQDPKEPRFIQTSRGKGYVFRV